MASCSNGVGKTVVLLSVASAVRRAGLESLLKETPAVRLAGSVYGVPNLLTHVRDREVDVLLVDLERPDPQLISVATALQELGSRPAIVTLIDNPEPAWTVAALRAGVKAL